MALPATETFTGAVGNLGASWTQQRTTRRVKQNGSGVGVQDAIDTPADVTAFWNADAFPNDQYAQASIAGLGTTTSRSINVLVRASGSGDAAWNAYEFYTNGSSGAGNTELSRVNTGTATVLRNFATTFAVNDVLRLEVKGFVLEAFKNAVSLGTFDDSASGSKIASGSAGVGSYADGAGTLPTFDNWEGGSLAVAVVPRDLAHTQLHQAMVAQ